MHQLPEAQSCQDKLLRLSRQQTEAANLRNRWRPDSVLLAPYMIKSLSFHSTLILGLPNLRTFLHVFISIGLRRDQ